LRGEYFLLEKVMMGTKIRQFNVRYGYTLVTKCFQNFFDTVSEWMLRY
jgi:hypothetical protein